MKEKRLNTLINFINSNKSFFSAINDNTSPKLDDYLRYELLLIYFNSNLKLIRRNDLGLFNVINSILTTTNYYIENGILYINNHSYELTYLQNLVLKVEEFKKNEVELESAILTINHSTISTKNFNGDCKIYYIRDFQHPLLYDMNEREIIFRYTTSVDKITEPYIHNVYENFNSFLSSISLSLLFEKEEFISKKDFFLLYSYLNLYPLLCYGTDLVDFPFERLNIPQNEIGLAKISLEEQVIIGLEKELKETSLKKESLSNQKRLLEENSPTNPKIKEISRLIFGLEKKEIELIFRIYSVSHYEHIYNPNLLKNLFKSFTSGYVDFSYDYEVNENPHIKLFHISQKETDFYSAMRLSTLVNLINNDNALKLLQDSPVLSLSN